MSKLALKDILEAVDQGGRDLWDLFDEEQKKDVKFFLKKITEMKVFYVV